MTSSWFLVLYLIGSDNAMVSKESFKTLEDCGNYFNSVQEELKKMKNLRAIKCEEGSIVNPAGKTNDPKTL